jgi:hypothetical protein
MCIRGFALGNNFRFTLKRRRNGEAGGEAASWGEAGKLSFLDAPSRG